MSAPSLNLPGHWLYQELACDLFPLCDELQRVATIDSVQETYSKAAFCAASGYKGSRHDASWRVLFFSFHFCCSRLAAGKSRNGINPPK